MSVNSTCLYGDREGRGENIHMSKLIPINITPLNDIEDIMSKCHDVFKNTLAVRDKKPKLGEREIYVPLNWIDYKAEIFWHSASIEPPKSIDILPCNNDITSTRCFNNCLERKNFIIMNNGQEREKCIYRAVRVGWIKDIIEMYNNKDNRINYWEKLHSKKKNRIYLRYQEDEIDYIVILEEKSIKRVQLITAYPVFSISYKKRYEKEYGNYIKTIKNR